MVFVESIKFSDAQKRPDSAFVRVSHRELALQALSVCAQTHEVDFQY